MWKQVPLSGVANPEGMDRSGLGDEAVVSVRATVESGKTRYRGIIDRTLDSDGLNILTNAASQYPPFDTISILADWKAPDNPDWPLHAMHSSMGEPWRHFMAHRKTLIDILTVRRPNSALRSTLEERGEPSFIPGKNRARAMAAEGFVAPEFNKKREILRKIGLIRHEHAREVNAVVLSYKLHLQGRQGGSKKYKGKDMHLQELSVTKLRRLMRLIADAVPEQILEAADNAIRTTRAEALSLAKMEPERRLEEGYAEHRGIYVAKNFVSALEGNTRIDTGDYDIAYEWKLTNEGNFYASPTSITDLNAKGGILVEWTRDSDGKRDFVMDPVDHASSAEYGSLTERRSENEKPTIFSAMFGVIAVAALEPGITKDWPTTMGLPGGAYKQSMRGAQIPVLALMMRKQLLDSGIVKLLEKIAQA